MVCDTGMWDPDTPAITTSLRGLVYEEVIISAANRDLHSGHFRRRRSKPDPGSTRILGGLHDDDGRITLPGFYDGVKDLPSDIRAAVGSARSDAGSIPEADRTLDSCR